VGKKLENDEIEDSKTIIGLRALLNYFQNKKVTQFA
jgi:hypothetical protein